MSKLEATIQLEVCKVTTTASVARGLEGIVSHETRLSEVDGTAGRLTIAGYEVSDLVGHASFEEVAHLLWLGRLPNQTELVDLRREMAQARSLPNVIRTALGGSIRQATGMHALRVAAAFLSLDDPDVDEIGPETSRARAIRLTARVPMLVAAHFRLRQGLAVAVPPDHLGFAATYLYALEGQEADPARVAALDAYLVAVIEHGMNASTFTARVIASTNSDMVSAITGAIGALKGPAHGGVPGPVLDMLAAVGSPEQAETWVRSALARGERIMGFGHRVYKVRDPRAELLERAAEELAVQTGDRRLLELTGEVERVTVRVLSEAKPGHDLYANVELYAALILHTVGIPHELFTPTFAVARMAGWTAHILEQYSDNRLIRPQASYVGPRGRAVSYQWPAIRAGSDQLSGGRPKAAPAAEKSHQAHHLPDC